MLASILDVQYFINFRNVLYYKGKIQVNRFSYFCTLGPQQVITFCHIEIKIFS